MAEGPEIQVVVLDEDPGDVQFDERGTPLLQFERHPEHGEGWVLYFLDQSGGTDDHFIPGRVEDVETVLAEARAWLMETWWYSS